MKSKKEHKREKNKSLKDNTRDGKSRRIKTDSKIKYRHKSHWLDEEDDDYTSSNFSLEEE